jgi:CO dehydrogenase/acetyl-CoA synthase beta subunit
MTSNYKLISSLINIRQEFQQLEVEEMMTSSIAMQLKGLSIMKAKMERIIMREASIWVNSTILNKERKEADNRNT